MIMVHNRMDFSEEEDKSEDDYDPEYTMFLENLREDGKSHVLEVAFSDGSFAYCKYEDPDETDSEFDPQTEQFSNSNTDSGFRNGKEGEMIDKTNDLRIITVGDKGELAKSLSKVKKGKEAKQTRAVNVTGNIPQEFKIYLDNLKKVGDELVYVNSNAEPSHKCSHMDIIMTENALDLGEGNVTPFVSSKVLDASRPEKPSRNDHSQFRKDVMNILRRPYDQKEFDMFLEMVKERKPIEGLRNLRSGRSKVFQENKYGKSYLDYYVDLQKVLDETPFGSHRMLNILRGFVFWLKNLGHEEAFRPWLDKSCLAVIPTKNCAGTC